MLTNSKKSYGWVAITIHWLSAALVFGLFAVGYWMVDLDYYSNWYHTAPHYHQSVGLLLTLLTLVRLIWMLANPKPLLLSEKQWQNRLAHLVHLLLYLLLLSLFASGYLIVTLDGAPIAMFNWFELPSVLVIEDELKQLVGEIHKYAAYALMALVTLHALAAFKHHIINKDKTLLRMLKVIK